MFTPSAASKVRIGSNLKLTILFSAKYPRFSGGTNPRAVKHCPTSGGAYCISIGISHLGGKGRGELETSSLSKISNSP